MQLNIVLRNLCKVSSACDLPNIIKLPLYAVACCEVRLFTQADMLDSVAVFRTSQAMLSL